MEFFKPRFGKIFLQREKYIFQSMPSICRDQICKLLFIKSLAFTPKLHHLLFGKTTTYHTVGKTGTKKKFWILDFTRFCYSSEFSGL